MTCAAMSRLSSGKARDRHYCLRLLQRIAAGSVMTVEPAATVEPVPPADLNARRLWHAISVCSPHGVILQLPAGLAGTNDVEQLVSTGLADRLDPLRVRLNASSRLAAHADTDTEPLRTRHAQAVYAALVRPDSATELMAAEIHLAFHTALETDWPFARDLGRRAADVLRGLNRLGEAAHLLTALADAAKERNDAEAVRSSLHELSWIDGGHELFRYPVQLTEQLGFNFS